MNNSTSYSNTLNIKLSIYCKNKIEEILEKKSDTVKTLLSNFNEDVPISSDNIYYHPSTIIKNYGFNMDSNKIYNKRTKKSYTFDLKKEKLKNYIMNTECYKKTRLFGGKYFECPIKFKWECYNKKILTENCIIEFKDGNYNNININNLEVIS